MGMDRATVERLAQRIHENYLTRFDPDGQGWDDLTDDLREANRDQARAIADKLAAIGAKIQRSTKGRGRFAFSEVELDRLARDEHERWAKQRESAGWSYGPERDNQRLLHPMLVDWEDLPEPEREKDRDAVRNIPDVLAAAGLRVIRSRT